jgi:sugar/nucleoside kinase (ribokinase family)
MIVTLGPDGAECNGQRFSAPRVEVSDVCGAGDTFLSALAYCYVNTASIEQAIQFAITASAVTVQHLGVYAPTLQELE